jgi:hypothetical protein
VKYFTLFLFPIIKDPALNRTSLSCHPSPFSITHLLKKLIYIRSHSTFHFPKPGDNRLLINCSSQVQFSGRHKIWDGKSVMKPSAARLSPDEFSSDQPQPRVRRRIRRGRCRIVTMWSICRCIRERIRLLRGCVIRRRL